MTLPLWLVLLLVPFLLVVVFALGLGVFAMIAWDHEKRRVDEESKGWRRC